MTHFWPIFDPFLTPFLDPFWAKIPPKKGLFRSKRGLKRGSKSDPKSDHFRPPSEGSPILIPVKSTRKWHPWPGDHHGHHGHPAWFYIEPCRMPMVAMVAMGGGHGWSLYTVLYTVQYSVPCRMPMGGSSDHPWSDHPWVVRWPHFHENSSFWHFGSFLRFRVKIRMNSPWRVTCAEGPKMTKNGPK